MKIDCYAFQRFQKEDGTSGRLRQWGGFVIHPEDYPYSSARDYSGEKGYLDIVLIE